MGKLINSDYELTFDPGHKDYQKFFDDTFGNVAPVYPMLFRS